MPKRLIIFDFDGTLADTAAAGILIYNNLAGKKGFLKITSQNEYALRDLSARQVIRELKIPLVQLPLVIRSLHSGLKEEIRKIRPIPGIKSVVVELKKMGFSTGILTSNSLDNTSQFLESNGFPGFDFIHARIGIFGKTRALGRIVIQSHFARKNISYVGDEIRDIEAAAKNKVRAIAATWGLNSKKSLSLAQPDFIIDKPQELVGILTRE